MTDLTTAPVLSTPEDILPIASSETVSSTLSDASLQRIYEIPSTAQALLDGSYNRIALQFPDHLLTDAPRVATALQSSLPERSKVHILADTSYSACCVDEIAAEHVDAQVVVHYGRSCLSPVKRLPVLYVHTEQELDRDVACEKFEKEFADREAKVVVMADLTYQHHVKPLVSMLKERGYTGVVRTEVVRDPAGAIPNRRIPDAELDAETLKTYSLFHISDPPTSVLLALHSRFASLHILSPNTSSIDNPTMRTAGLLRRRFARVLSLASAGVVGILVNTLSVANSIESIDLLRKKIAAAGKKSYTVVVGRLNPAKLANFAEVEGWVVVGCWEGGLVEEDAGYWRPVITPFEMEVALMKEEERVWGGEWWGGIEKMKLEEETGKDENQQPKRPEEERIEVQEDLEDGVDEDESLPPEFDLRTGKFVSHSRPMRLTVQSKSSSGANKASEALIKRSAPGELASINGVASPGAEFLKSGRTWQGLGTDFAENTETSTIIEEGRSGIARGYTVAEGEKH